MSCYNHYSGGCSLVKNFSKSAFLMRSSAVLLTLFLRCTSVPHSISNCTHTPQQLSQSYMHTHTEAMVIHTHTHTQAMVIQSFGPYTHAHTQRLQTHTHRLWSCTYIAEVLVQALSGQEERGTAQAVLRVHHCTTLQQQQCRILSTNKHKSIPTVHTCTKARIIRSVYWGLTKCPCRLAR